MTRKCDSVLHAEANSVSQLVAKSGEDGNRPAHGLITIITHLPRKPCLSHLWRAQHHHDIVLGFVGHHTPCVLGFVVGS